MRGVAHVAVCLCVLDRPVDQQVLRSISITHIRLYTQAGVQVSAKPHASAHGMQDALLSQWHDVNNRWHCSLQRSLRPTCVRSCALAPGAPRKSLTLASSRHTRVKHTKNNHGIR